MKFNKNRIVPFTFKPFSVKQSKVLTWWTDPSPYKEYDAIIADGSVRSGKTVSMSLSYVLWAMEKFNGHNFAFCGKTIYSCRRNVVKPLKQMLISRGYKLHDARSENVITIASRNSNGQEVINYFHIFGGSNEASQDLIQGITLAGALFDEVALMPESFVNQATARCSVDGSKFWFNCNPGQPFHWFKKLWIDRQEEKQVLYLHFTMVDNPSLTDKVRKRYESMYTGVFYKRYILGMWVLADGVVYPMFDQDKHCIDLYRNWTRIFIAGDFGIQNATTFGLYGYYEPEKRYHLIDRYYHSGRDSGQKTTKQYLDDLIAFINKSNTKPSYLTLDPSASAMLVELRKSSYFKRRGIRILPAKNNVDIGLQLVSYMLSVDKFTLYKECEHDKEEFGSYVWNTDRLDKGVEEVMKDHDHCMDSNRYAIMTDSLIYRTNDNIVKSITGRGALTS